MPQFHRQTASLWIRRVLVRAQEGQLEARCADTACRASCSPARCYSFCYSFLPGFPLPQLRWMRHHVEQRVVGRLLVAGEQRLHVLPPTRNHERLERHVAALGCPLPAVRMPPPALESRDTGLPFGAPELLTEDLARPRLVL